MACTRRTRRRDLAVVAYPLVPGDARRSTKTSNRSVVLNPYSPTHTDGLEDLVPSGRATTDVAATAPSRIGNGPSVVICLGGFCGLLLASPFLGAPQNPVHWTFSSIGTNATTLGIAIALSGWIIGGLVYRMASIRWPCNHAVLNRQIIASLPAQLLPPLIVYLLFGTTYPHLLALAACFGMSIVIAVFASGRRRFPTCPKTVEPCDATEPGLHGLTNGTPPVPAR